MNIDKSPADNTVTSQRTIISEVTAGRTSNLTKYLLQPIAEYSSCG